MISNIVWYSAIMFRNRFYQFCCNAFNLGTEFTPALCGLIFFLFHFPGTSISDTDIGKPFGAERVVIESGSNLTEVLISRRVKHEESLEAISALRKVYDVDNIPANHKINLVLGNSDSARLVAMSFLAPNQNGNNAKRVELYKDDSGKFNAKVSDEPYQRRIVKISSVIKTSLFSAVLEKGVPQSTVMNLIGIYDDVINFRKSVKASDQVEIVFERFFDQEGNFIKDGKILYASIKSPNPSSANLEVYRHVFQNGEEGYFDSRGRNVKKTTLGAPVAKTIRISSKFGWRTHPILGYSHFHRGIDFAAAYGTPIYAASDGVIEFVGSKGGYGKYIKIKHNDDYTTIYGHLSKFGKGIKRNSLVKHGQIIAYSGSSGLATGPHLHYEVLFRNKPVDPSDKLTSSQSGNLVKDELVRFRKNVKQLDGLLKGVTYASAE